jgi:hypothetical protein
MSIFFTEVPKDVQAALNSRKRVYSRTDSREEADFAWLYRKMAYVSAFVANPKNNKKASLTTPSAGGLGKNSLYTTNDNAKFIPKPHINTFKTYSDGDFGSLQKCELAFTVYTLSDLDSYQTFFDLGADIIVNYGWNAGGPASGKPGKFEGIIYNFSYSVNSSGGFDCITYGIAKGSFVLGINITAGTDVAETTEDGLGNVRVSNSLLDDIQQLANRSSTFQKQIDNNGIGYDEIQFSLKDAVAEGPQQQTPIKYYITLEKLVELINTNLFLKSEYALKEYTLKTANDEAIEEYDYQQSLPVTQRDYVDGVYNPYAANIRNLPQADNATVINRNKNVDKTKFIIICNSTYTRGLVPKETGDLVSANPLQILFPGYATYGDITYFSDAPLYNEAFKNGDISKILLNIKWLKDLYNNIGFETQDRQKSADQSIAKFLSKIFNAILDNSGDRFKLSMTSDPENDKRLVISDVNYIDKTVSPYIITAVNNQSICRNISLASKVPSAMASAAFISARSTLTTQSSVVGEVLNNIPSKAADKKSITTLRNNLKDCIKNLQVAAAPDPPNTEKIPNAADKIRSLQSALKAVFEATTSSPGALNVPSGVSDAPKNAIPFPIDFSATLDGINGFKFGNTITTNYLPAVYKNTRIAFTVTKVEHTIQNNDWVTTLSTICRVLPDNQNKSTENEYDSPLKYDPNDPNLLAPFNTVNVQPANTSDVPEGSVF